MSDTPYRIELIVYPDRTIEFKGDAFEIESAKRILLPSSQALARREAIEEAMRVVEEFKVKGLGNLSNRGVEGFQKEVSTQKNEMLLEISEALQEKLDTKGD